MIGQTISHYAPKAHPLNESSTTRWVDRPVGSLRPLADKILEKLGEVPKSPTSVFSPEGMASPRVVATLIPLCGTPLFGGSGRSIVL